jgi:hypothetical protein
MNCRFYPMSCCVPPSSSYPSSSFCKVVSASPPATCLPKGLSELGLMREEDVRGLLTFRRGIDVAGLWTPSCEPAGRFPPKKEIVAGCCSAAIRSVYDGPHRSSRWMSLNVNPAPTRSSFCAFALQIVVNGPLTLKG